MTQDLYLNQHVDFPTRYREGQKPSTLDLIFTNEDFMVENLGEIAPLGKSDMHVGSIWIYVCIAEVVTRKDLQGSSLNYNKGAYNKIRQDLQNVDWEKEMGQLDCEDSWQALKRVYNQTVDDHIPLKKAKKRYKPPVMAKKSIKRKYSLYKRYRKTQNYIKTMRNIRDKITELEKL